MELWQVIFWGVVAVALIVVEIFTVQFVSVWFAAGGLVAFVAAFMNADFYLQVILFLTVSAVLLFSTRPLLHKFIKRPPILTNADSLAGQLCTVRDEVSLSGTGRVIVAGQDWAARASAKGLIIPAGTVCVIEEIQGVTLIIHPSDSNTK